MRTEKRKKITQWYSPPPSLTQRWDVGGRADEETKQHVCEADSALNENLSYKLDDHMSAVEGTTAQGDPQ